MSAAEPLRIVRLWQDGWRAAVMIGAGPRWCRVIVADAAGLRVGRVPADEELHMRYFPHDYTEQGLVHFRSMAARFGCTVEVARVLGIANGSARILADETPVVTDEN